RPTGHDADPRPLASSTQHLEMLRQIAQMAIDPERAARLAGECMEVLVARERPRLLLEALDEPVEELAHGAKLPLQARENRLDFQGRGRAVRAIWATISSPAAPRQTSSRQANSITSVPRPSSAAVYTAVSVPSSEERSRNQVRLPTWTASSPGAIASGRSACRTCASTTPGR